MTECPYKRIRLESGAQASCVERNEDSEGPKTIEKVGEESSAPVNGNSLQVFHVLDETDGDSENVDNDEDGEDYDSDTGWIDTMLDANLPDDLKNKKNIHQYEEKFKSVMEAKGHNHFDLLPEGWVQVTHDSGMPLYLHRSTRVCSASLPYFLGNGSVRKHEIPLGAIPCLNYRIALDKEKEQLEEHKKMMEEKASMEVDSTTKDQPPQNGLSTALNLNTAPLMAPKLLAMPNAKIETVAENFKKQNLTSVQVVDYCKKLFLFKTIRVMRFTSWSARRKFTKNRKHIKHLQRPSLPDGTKLITFPILNTEAVDPNSTTSSHARPKKEWIMNPNGKSYVCILHEYVQHALKKQPSYDFKELENAATPYSATVSIDGLNYGVGHGTSKKQAKGEAARVTLEILIPEMREKITGGNKTNSNGSAAPKEPVKALQDLSVFDEIRIEDPRVAEFCQKTTEPSPHAILLTCLQRNYGLGDVKVNYEVNTAKHKKNEFTMTVGKHSAKVFCKNKREGKQQAAQAILQIIHPHIKTWGSLLRLYGNRSVKSFKEKKQEEQEITVLQSKAAINQPNYAILDKLKLEMNKLKDRKASVIPLSSFISPDLPCTSGSNLNNVNL